MSRYDKETKLLATKTNNPSEQSSNVFAKDFTYDDVNIRNT